ncbi:phage shock envelope stress response protein PspM [Actinocrispum wychmicini]|uniref:Uncharacterized protein n=1 Tax=Actinocrispum wychmicini TaxID=1213861 RepID=A0A4R2JR93_9PSEU|nr:hypothetical protein [Actinocrispum wychmicini]TCO56695.1 hypothetical protein EV192_106169 [Actinocrispum wychmicini]
MDRPRRAEFAELRQLVERQLRGVDRQIRGVDRHIRGPIADHVRAQLETHLGRWTDPAVKLERRRKRAETVMWLFLFLGLLLGVVATVLIVTAGPGAAGILQGATTGVVALGAFVVAGKSGAKMRALKRTPLPEPAATLPPTRSLAREPMQRLADAERALAELLRQLGSPRSNVPPDTVQHARDTGAEAAAALREVAAQLQSVERARDLAPSQDRAALEDGVRMLRDQLDQGLDGYGGLIAAAGRLVAASSTGGPDKQALTDASDRLHGLAMALKDLFGDQQR